MNKKIIVILLFGILLLSPLFASFAHAQAPMSPVKSVLKVIADNFGFLFTESFRRELVSGTGDAIIFVKILFAMIIILPLFYLLKLAFGEKSRGIAGIVSIIIGIISVMLIPGSTLLTLATTYGAVATIFLYALPVGAIFFFYKFIQNTIAKKSEALASFIELIAMILGVGFMTQIQATLMELAKENSVIATLIDNQWLALLYGVFGVGAFYALYKLITYYRAYPETLLGKRLWEGGGGGVGLGGGISPVSPAVAVTPPVITTAEEARVAQIMSDIERADREFLSNINTLKGLSTGELQTLEGIGSALEKVADAIDATKAVYLSAIAYKSAAIPDAEKRAGIERMNQNLRENSAKIQEQLQRVSDGFSKILVSEEDKIKTLETYERVEGEKIRNDIKKLYAMIEEWKTIAKEDIDKNTKAIETITNQLTKMEIPAGKTIADLTSELESLRKTNESYAKLQAELDSLTNSEVRKLDDSLTQLLRTIALTHSDIETFKKMINTDVDKINSSIQLITKEEPIEQDFKNASSSIRAIANDEIPKMKLGLEKNSEAINVLGGEINTIQQQIKNLSDRITQLIEKI